MASKGATALFCATSLVLAGESRPVERDQGATAGCAPAGAQATGVTPTRASADWNQLEEEIRARRDLVRMCGPLSAARVIQAWGLRLKDGFWEEARARLTADGVPLGQVVDWCREANPSARGVLFVGRLDKDRLRSLTLPCIVVVNEGHHCLVLEAMAADAEVVRVWDPSDLEAKPMPTAQLLAMWNGAAIVGDSVEHATRRYLPGERGWLVAGGCGLVAQSLAAWRWRTAARGQGRCGATS